MASVSFSAPVILQVREYVYIDPTIGATLLDAIPTVMVGSGDENINEAIITY